MMHKLAFTLAACLFLAACGQSPDLRDGNLANLANAGESQVRPDDEGVVYLDGSTSGADGRTIASFRWVQKSGIQVTLRNADSDIADFDAPDVGSDQELVFELTVTDADGNIYTDEVTVVITDSATNSAPQANAGADQEVKETREVQLDASQSNDSDGELVFFQWTQTAGPQAELNDANSETPSFTAPDVDEATTLVFAVEVVDNQGKRNTDSVEITVLPLIPPAAEAGPAQTVEEQTTVQLDGSVSSDSDGEIVSYSWRQASGSPNVQLNNADTATPSFFAPDVSANAQITFELVVTDDDELTARDFVVVNIIANQAPSANAGPDQTVSQNSQVTLDGSASEDGDGTIDQYHWEQTAGTPVNLSNRNAAQPTFSAPVGGSQTLTFVLTVTDNDDDSAQDSVDIFVADNTAPSVNAGADQNANEGDSVNLNGSATDSDSSNLSYQWTQTSDGPQVSINNDNSASANFTAPNVSEATVLTFILTVTDAEGASSQDQVQITVNTLAPTANAGPDQSQIGGGTIQLDGTGTGGNGNLSYQWTETSTNGTTLSPNNSAEDPSFTAPNATTTYIFELTVTDADGDSHTDTVTITIEEDIQPNAEAGNGSTITGGEQGSLNGSASTEGNPSTTYLWSNNDGITIDNPNQASTTFTAPSSAGDYTFTLTLTDGNGDQSSDTVTFTVAEDLQPVANAGDDTTVTGGEQGSLNGSASTEGNPSTSYAWSNAHGISITNADQANASFTAPSSPGNYSFTLTLTDADGDSHADTVVFTVISDEQPTANAGPDQAQTGGGIIQLDGFGAGGNGTLSYQWTETTSHGVTLSPSNTAEDPSFVAPNTTATYTFDLVVTDEDGDSSSADSVTITITEDLTPSANAGPDQSQTGGGTIQLDGTGTGGNGTLNYQWTETSAHGVTLSPSNSAEDPSFVAPNANATYTFELVVTDEDGSTSTADSVTITITEDLTPSANAGPDQSQTGGGTIQLDGTGSGGNGNLSYQWTETSAHGVTLSPSNTAEDPSFVAPNSSATYTFELVVTDEDGSTSAADNITITITEDLTPTANAGPDQAQIGGGTIQLDGTGTGGNGTLTYQWNETSSHGAALTPSSTSEDPSFVAPNTTATYTFDLVVTDEDGDSSVADSVTITITEDLTPSADAGPDQSQTGGGTIQLNGTGTGGNGTLSYQWSETSTHGVTLSPSNTAEDPSFVAPNTSATYTFELVVTDGDGSTSTADSVTISITEDLTPSANAGPDQAQTGGGTIQLNGTGTGGNGTLTYQWTETSTHGVTLSPSNTAEDPSFVAPNTSATYTFELVVTDEDGSTSTADSVTITITEDLTPAADAGPDQSQTGGGTVQLNGTGTGGNGTLSYQWTETSTHGVTLSPSNTAEDPSFVAPNTSATYTFELVVSDEDGSTSTADSVTITITEDLTPSANAGPDQSQTGGGTIQLNGTGTGGNGTLSYQWTETSTHGVTLSPSNTTEDPSFIAPNTSATYTFELVVTDEDGSTSAADSVTITITEDLTPTADAGPDQAQTDGGIIQLNGTGTGGNGTLSYQWTETSSHGVTLLPNSTSEDPSFVAPNTTATYTFELVVTDEDGDSSVADNVTISITENLTPVADAGTDDTLISGEQGSLDGSGSTEGNPTTTYAWTNDHGITITNADQPTAGFTAPATAGDYTFTLTLTDGDGETSSDTVTFTVEADIQPSANAGNDYTLIAGEEGTLNGSASSEGNPTTSYAWTNGHSITISNADQATATFTASSTPGDYTFTLTLTDADNDTSSDTVTVTVVADETPVANAGADRSITGNETGQLDGSASSDGNGTNTYLWSNTHGIVITNANQLQASFTAPNAAGDYTFTLTITDEDGDSHSDSVVFTVEEDVNPSADAGSNYSITGGETGSLDGSASTDGNGTNTYAWTNTHGIAITNADQLQASFTAPNAAGDYSFTLTITDEDGDQSSASVTVTVEADETPTADAGPDQNHSGSVTVNLNGTGSGGNGNLSYQWTETSGHGVVLTPGSTEEDPSFDAPNVTRSYTFELVVTDEDGDASAADSVTINITEAVGPVANAGDDREVDEDETVTLDGSASSDADGTITTYFWEQVDNGAPTVEIENENSEIASFVAPETSEDIELIFRLTVTDNDNNSDIDTVTITVSNSHITLSGVWRYQDVPFNSSLGAGLDYDNQQMLPIRHATSRAYWLSLNTDTTTTTENGEFRLRARRGQSDVRITVEARSVETEGAAQWDVEIRDNQNSNNLYSVQVGPFTAPQVDHDFGNLDIPSGWDNASSSYAGARLAGPFSILDQAYNAIQKTVAIDADVDFPALNIFWSELNANCDDESNPGCIGTSHYNPNDGALYIVGLEDSDTDEYDDHILIHEWGHYFEDRMSRSDSIGGSHSQGDLLDMRVALGEGFGNALSAIVLDDPIYRDSTGADQGSDGQIYMQPNYNAGWYAEETVQAYLYDLYDSGVGDDDSLSLGWGPLYEAFVATSYTDQDSLTSIFSFINELATQQAAQALLIRNLASERDINGIDQWGEQETNDAGGADYVLPVYQTLVPGTAELFCTTRSAGRYNKLSNRRFARFTATNNLHRIRAQTFTDPSPDTADTNLDVLYKGNIIEALRTEDANEDKTVILTTGETYVFEIYDQHLVFEDSNHDTCIIVQVD